MVLKGSWLFVQPVHMGFLDLVTVMDHVPWCVPWGGAPGLQGQGPVPLSPEQSPVHPLVLGDRPDVLTVRVPDFHLPTGA